jgi:hypothetical protein
MAQHFHDMKWSSSRMEKTAPMVFTLSLKFLCRSSLHNPTSVPLKSAMRIFIITSHPSSQQANNEWNGQAKPFH